MNEHTTCEWEAADLRERCDGLEAALGRSRTLACRARQLVTELITADGPDALWALVCAGLGETVIALDYTLKAIEMAPPPETWEPCLDAARIPESLKEEGLGD